MRKTKLLIFPFAFISALIMAQINNVQMPQSTIYGYTSSEQCIIAKETLENDCTPEHNGVQCTVLLDTWEVASAYTSAANQPPCLQILRRN